MNAKGLKDAQCAARERDSSEHGWNVASSDACSVAYNELYLNVATGTEIRDEVCGSTWCAYSLGRHRAITGSQCSNHYIWLLNRGR